MMEAPKLGSLITGEAYRDAVHIAIAPVEAAQELAPGDDVKIIDGIAYFATIKKRATGIVDPFLEGIVNKGERFYVWLYPNSITSLRHVWTHPDFIAKLPETM